ncbi:PD-(D/E)XK nuclease family protein [Mucilaginibacter terrae]|uniref:PD-(D/E)XK nuclease family protein n=1 Tax=Mucilaginibacter terrae TaxID=1955052 RepID=UPI003635DBE7
MPIETSDIDIILNEFLKLPKRIKQPTYLELCKYPYNRFEEICSRLLCFYLDPSKEHNLKDLVIKSLITVIDVNITLNFNDINIYSEDNAEGKRIDILIHSNEFVIGIENKITATLYNPLEKYRNRIALYNKRNAYCIVLSLRKVINKEELNYMQLHGFKNVTYSKLFEAIKQNIPSYTSNANPIYITYLQDFMDTLNNLTGQQPNNEELANYFFDNSSKIDELIKYYDQYNNRVSNVQNENIAQIKEQLNLITEAKWWAWEKYLLGCSKSNNLNQKLGIEAQYEATKLDSLGLFHISFVTWSLSDWNVFEAELLQEFPNGKINKSKTKCSIEIDTVPNNDITLILNKLKGYYQLLLEIIHSVPTL